MTNKPTQKSVQIVDTDKNDISGLIDQGVHLDRVSASLEKGLEPEEVRKATELVAEISGAAPWWVGDLMCESKKRFGEQWALDIAEDLPIEVKTLKNWFYTAKLVPPDIRNKNLSWSHHKEVKKVKKREKMVMWLEKAEEEDLSVRELREQINEAENPDTGKTKTLSVDGHHSLSQSMPKALQEAGIKKHQSMLVEIQDGEIVISQMYEPS